jgi:hypothetical protein
VESTSQEKSIHHEGTNSEHWKTALATAEHQLHEAKKRVTGLKYAIRIFRERMQRNDPWPVETGKAEFKQ